MSWFRFGRGESQVLIIVWRGNELRHAIGLRADLRPQLDVPIDFFF